MPTSSRISPPRMRRARPADDAPASHARCAATCASCGPCTLHVAFIHGARNRRRVRSIPNPHADVPMFKFLGKTAGVIFLIGLIVVIGLLMLIF